MAEEMIYSINGVLVVCSCRFVAFLFTSKLTLKYKIVFCSHELTSIFV